MRSARPTRASSSRPCFAASVARGEVFTQPTLLHNPNAVTQHSEPIGLTLEQRAALIDGMEACVTEGTGKRLNQPAFKLPLRIAGKTGTAQIPGKKNVAWFICFAPIENPQIALAEAIEGENSGESLAGGLYAAPVAQAVLKTWLAKQNRPTSSRFSLPVPSTP